MPSLGQIAKEPFYKYCKQNIPRLRDIQVKLTDPVLHSFSDYAWEQVLEIFDDDSFSVLIAVELVITPKNQKKTSIGYNKGASFRLLGMLDF